MAKSKIPHPLEEVERIIDTEAIHAAIDDEVLTGTLDDEIQGLWTIEVEAEDCERGVFLSVEVMGEDGEENQSVCIGLSDEAVNDFIAMLHRAQAFAGKAIL